MLKHHKLIGFTACMLVILIVLGSAMLEPGTFHWQNEGNAASTAILAFSLAFGFMFASR